MRIFNKNLKNAIALFFAKTSPYWAPFFIKHRQHVALARFFVLSLPQIAYANEKWKSKNLKVLCLNKSIFMDDVYQGLIPQGYYNIYNVERRFFKMVIGNFLPYIVHDNKYKTDDPAMIKGKKKAAVFLEKFLDELLIIFPFEAMITGNMVYWAEQELANLLDKKGVAFVACHKESIQAPKLYNQMLKVRLKGNEPFKGTMVLTYNERTKNQIIDGKMFDKNKVQVVGMPRLDTYHKIRKCEKYDSSHENNRPMVLCLLISLISQLPCLVDPNDKIRWTRLADQTHQAIFEMANSYKDIDFIIKHKPSDQNQVDNILKRFGKTIPNNVHFTYTESLFSLVKKAKLIIGHNSSAVFEAIAAGKLCIIPHYEEVHDPRFSGRLIEYGDSVHYVDSPDALKKLTLNKVLSTKNSVKELNSAQKKLLKFWLGNIDGCSGYRMAEGILYAIQQKKSNNNCKI